jgi:hypothetical protein
MYEVVARSPMWQEKSRHLAFVITVFIYDFSNILARSVGPATPVPGEFQFIVQRKKYCPSRKFIAR